MEYDFKQYMCESLFLCSLDEECKNPPHADDGVGCIEHCEEKGHGHCTWFLCEEDPHEGSVEQRCEDHCLEDRHGHLSKMI